MLQSQTVYHIKATCSWNQWRSQPRNLGGGKNVGSPKCL